MTQYGKESAFTLAEVLITLLIIGVVAALVVPNLINDSKNAEYVTGLKKAYSDFSQAFKLLQVENGGSIVPVFSDDTTTGWGNGKALNAFLSKMPYIKNCSNSMGCWYNKPRYYLGGKKDTNDLDTTWDGVYEKAKLTNGTLILLSVWSNNCTYNAGSGLLGNSVCGSINVDVNGEKGPNKIGRDHFVFWVTQTGIYPRGSYNDGNTCEIDSIVYATSWGCAYKVLSENGMNY